MDEYSSFIDLWRKMLKTFTGKPHDLSEFKCCICVDEPSLGEHVLPSIAKPRNYFTKSHKDLLCILYFLWEYSAGVGCTKYSFITITITL